MFCSGMSALECYFECPFRGEIAGKVELLTGSLFNVIWKHSAHKDVCNVVKHHLLNNKVAGY